MSGVDPVDADIEAGVIDIISETLRVADIDKMDNLFTLGVDSLVGTRIAVKVQARFDVDVTLQDVFENPLLVDFIDLIVELADEPSAE